MREPPAIEWLRTGELALSTMLEEIGRARESIRLEAYIFGADAVGARFLNALVAARESGVKVRLLVDAFGSVGLPDSFLKPLTDRGGEVRWFNPLRAGRWSYRDHRKLLVCDGRRAVVGGFNVAEEYDGDGVERGWRDLGVRLTGEWCGILGRSFDAYFAAAEYSMRHRRGLRRASKRLPPDPMLLLTDSMRRRIELRRSLAKDLRVARQVRIMCSYFLPTSRLRRELMRVSRRGGLVQLLLPAKSDVLISQLATRRLYGRLLRAGIEIYEYQPQILHAKLFLIDDVLYLGSANLDIRSLRINHELLLRFRDRQLAAEAIQLFEKDLQRCRRIHRMLWRGSRGFWSQLRERWAYLVLARLDPYLARLQLRNR